MHSSGSHECKPPPPPHQLLSLLKHNVSPAPTKGRLREAGGAELVSAQSCFEMAIKRIQMLPLGMIDYYLDTLTSAKSNHVKSDVARCQQQEEIWAQVWDCVLDTA